MPFKAWDINNTTDKMIKKIKYKIGVDIGGTFTDVVLYGSDGTIRTSKVPSTPENYSVAILTGIKKLVNDARISFEKIESVVHGTTVATNTILEGKGAKTALLTTAGFRDVLEIARTRYAKLFDINTIKLKPLIPRRLRFEIQERIGAGGEIKIKLNKAEVKEKIKEIIKFDIQALAICFLHSYANPKHEQEVVKIARNLLPNDVFITCSSDVLPEIREYERTSTTAINAYLGPIVADYVSSLSKSLQNNSIKCPLQIMQSNGGIMSSRGILKKPATIVESGPAAGVIGAARAAANTGYKNLISLDLGGTTAKASIIEEGRLTKSSLMEVGGGENFTSKMSMGKGHALKLPVIDVSEVGAGGGSLVQVDRYQRLLVGPKSAGAVPGPVAYDKGGKQTTLSDALLILGYLNPKYLVGGEMLVNLSKASDILFKNVAKPFNYSLNQAAYGIAKVATVNMMAAVRSVSTNRGRDPRDFDLFAFGGTGPVLAAELAKQLGIGRIIIPQNPGLFSAFGLLHSNIEYDYVQTFLKPGVDLSNDELNQAFLEIETKAVKELAEDGYKPNEIKIRRQADLQYAGQAFELTIDIDKSQLIEEIVEEFEKEHEAVYGHRAINGTVNLLSLRLLASINKDFDNYLEPQQVEESLQHLENTEMTRKAYFGEKFGSLETQVCSRKQIKKEMIKGPIIIEEYDSTVVVPPDFNVRLDNHYNLIIEKEYI